MVSEMLYAGKSLAEIAGYDDRFIQRVLGLPRDKYGRLVRKNPDLPEGVEVDEDGMRIVTRRVPFGKMYKTVMEKRGMDETAADRSWQDYLKFNPRAGGASSEN